jgi:GTP-binding protein
VEFYASLRTERAIDRAGVCVLVLDAADGLHTQDLKVAAKAWEQGTGLVIAVNKWDLVKKETNTAEQGRQAAIERAPFLDAVPFIFISALEGQRAGKVLEAVLEVAEARRKRIPTHDVNEALREMISIRQPPQEGGAEVKLFYGAQVAIEPPTFAIVCSRPETIPDSYRRFLVNGLRERFGFAGSPIRVKFTRRRRKTHSA